MPNYNINRSKFSQALTDYISACTETDWLSVGEIYKFHFADWLFKKVDFQRQTDDQILDICIASQDEKFDGKTKGVNFLDTPKRYGNQIIELKDIQTIRYLFEGGPVVKEKIKTSLSLPKFSAWLATLLPNQYNTCPRIDLIFALEYLFDEKNLPKKGFNSFVKSQELLSLVRKEIHDNIDKFTSISAKFDVIKEITPVVEVWLVQDLIFYIRKKILVDKEMFTWVPLFEELGNKLLLYKDKQPEIIQKLIDSGIDEGFNDINANGETIQLKEIDPLTVFASITKYGEEKVVQIAKKLKVNFELNSEAPRDAWGIPRTFPQNVWFFGYQKDREPDRIQILWELFEQALNNNIDEGLFDKVMGLHGIGITKLTSNLYKARPSQYLTIDKNTIYYLKTLTIKTDISSLPDYFSIIEQAKEKAGLKLYEISHLAYMENNYEDFIDGANVEEPASHPPMPQEKVESISKLISEGSMINLEPYTKEEALQEIFLTDLRLDEVINSLEYKNNIILQGPPGTGKTFIAKRLAYLALGVKDNSKIEMIQFHQSYSYEDFIQGYRPTGDGKFQLKNGVFYEFCLRAQHDPENKYFFIIDEINRGNLSKIFGELMMLIEPDKRGRDFGIRLTYSGTDNEKFYLPENLYIIGTMNTADRSLAIVDYALRRRFIFIDINPSFHDSRFTSLLSNNGVNDGLIHRIISRFDDLNATISGDDNLGRWFAIGHSYFCSKPIVDESTWYKQVIENEIRPLLREYWFDDIEKAEDNVNKLLRD